VCLKRRRKTLSLNEYQRGGNLQTRKNSSSHSAMHIRAVLVGVAAAAARLYLSPFDDACAIVPNLTRKAG